LVSDVVKPALFIKLTRNILSIDFMEGLIIYDSKYVSTRQYAHWLAN